ncbi:hypothetical protein O181_014323 [Austropuccinia psidii MF-1]|uniref:Uncharacterized protein n=1 Tax=Austropuccinia psidii MF-1 TaxID=1389203 RepID=A0A9Q3GNY0_9BASI|nr:hypothetical protein [Austropuccinia psidii MF-1]
MTPTRSGSSYYIQSIGSGPGKSSHKSRRQEFQPRGGAQMEDARTSTSFQRLERSFENILESPEADITGIFVIRSEQLSTGISSNIPVSVQELVYSGKTAGVGTFSKPLDREIELLYSSEEVHGPRKERGPSKWLETHVLQMKSPEDKILVEKPRHFVRGPEQGQQPYGISSSPHKKKSASTSAKQGKESPKEQLEVKKGKDKMEQASFSELQNSKERKESHGKCVQFFKNFYGI